jgi:site-specific DNA-cytosine methylase
MGGFADPRGVLFYEISRLLHAKKPAGVLFFYNVPNLVYMLDCAYDIIHTYIYTYIHTYIHTHTHTHTHIHTNKLKLRV